MKNDIDFYMIQDKSIDKIFGAIDLNNMIPVMPNNYTKLTYENLDNFREFNNNREKKSYWKLLEKEAALLNGKKYII